MQNFDLILRLSFGHRKICINGRTRICHAEQWPAPQVQEGEAALGMVLENVEDEAGHKYNCCSARGGRLLTLSW
jgi:hypothetical protein